MWKVKEEKLQTNVTKYQILKYEKVISFKDWIDQIKNEQSFIEFYIDILKNSKYKAYFWEVKPITKNKLNVPFEFVLVNSNILPTIKSDDSFFRTYFKDGLEVVSFSNLGGDAQLVVPTQISDLKNYNHLASFMRNCQNNQIVKFWQKVGEIYEQQIGEEVKWLSTAGLGVSWLHVRIDSRPKYYRFCQRYGAAGRGTSRCRGYSGRPGTKANS